MIRESKHTLKFSNKGKVALLDRLFADYKEDLQNLIDLIWNNKLELKIRMSSKKIPKSIIRSGQYRNILYQQASQCVRGVLNRKSNKFKTKAQLTKPVIRNLSITLGKSFVESSDKNNSFDEYLKLKLPYVKEGYNTLRAGINLPVKHHTASNKFSTEHGWKRKKTIKLTKSKGIYYIHFFYEKEVKPKKAGKAKGFDCGYKKLLIDDKGNVYGDDLQPIYDKLCRRKPKSRGMGRAMAHRNNRINEVVNGIDLDKTKVVVVEDLKNVKKNTKGKRTKSFNNKLSRWSYVKTLAKLESVCQERGILFVKVSPAYTSQTCSKCGDVNASSRSGEKYHCVSCNMKMDADKNAARNILHRGDSNPSTTKIKHLQSI